MRRVLTCYALVAMTTIGIRNLRKEFGSVVAVDDVFLDVPAGDLFFLLGPSGCGKTTLLRMLAGFTDPTQGNIRFGDRDVTRLAPNRRNTGMVFQGYALWPHMTVWQNVAFGLGVRKVKGSDRDKRVQEALDLVQMGAYGQRRPNQLSGGQQQRVALARALVIEPTVLLLDEPLSNLDAKLRLEMRGQIRRICKEAGITAVYVTHDQKEALSMADNVALMQAGKVIQVASPRELYDRPVNRFAADFLGESNFIPAEVTGHQGEELVLRSPAGELRSTAFPATIMSGDAVTCSIRPEAIHLTDQPQPHNCFQARRYDVVYLGEVAQHHLVVGDDGMKLKVLEMHPQPITGDGSVHLRLAARDVVVLRD